jgi:hypothetical protein
MLLFQILILNRLLNPFLNPFFWKFKKIQYYTGYILFKRKKEIIEVILFTHVHIFV